MNGEKKCKHKLSELRAITKYGMTGMAVLMTAHCALLFEGYDAFVVHFLFWIFVGVIGIKLSQIFDLCWVHRLNVAYPLNSVIATDRQTILREVESLRTTAQQRIDNIHNDESIVSKCNSLIADLDPAQREKQANELRFSKIEESQAEIMRMLKKLTE